MQLVLPAEIAVNTSNIGSSAPETNLPEFDAGTTYAKDALVRDDSGLGATYRIYKSAQAGNLNHALSESAWWIDIGPTNTYAMFDASSATETIAPGSFDTTFGVQGMVDTIGLLNVDAVSVWIIVWDGGVTGNLIASRIVSLETGGVSGGWHEYFFEAPVRRRDIVLSDLPPCWNPTIRIVVNNGLASACSVGSVVTGKATDIGNAECGASIGITDYSRKDRDEFGTFSIVERACARKGSFTLLIAGDRVDEIYRTLSAYRATPALYVGSDSYAATVIYGFFRDFNIELSYPEVSMCTLELEGLT